MRALDTTFVRFAELLGNRVDVLHAAGTDPEMICWALVDAGLDPKKADGLAWGTGAQLTREEVGLLSRQLQFMPELIGAILSGGQLELERLFAQVDAMLRDDCVQCDDLRDGMQLFLETGSGSIAELLWDLAQHIIVVDESQSTGMTADDWTTESDDRELELEPSDWTEELVERRARLGELRELLGPEAAEALDLLEQLPEEARLKVLGYTLDLVELEQWEED